MSWYKLTPAHSYFQISQFFARFELLSRFPFYGYMMKQMIGEGVQITGCLIDNSFPVILLPVSYLDENVEISTLL